MQVRSDPFFGIRLKMMDPRLFFLPNSGSEPGPSDPNACSYNVKRKPYFYSKCSSTEFYFWSAANSPTLFIFIWIWLAPDRCISKRLPPPPQMLSPTLFLYRKSATWQQWLWMGGWGCKGRDLRHDQLIGRSGGGGWWRDFRHWQNSWSLIQRSVIA